MNCEQVRTLVDALPREHWNAAQEALVHDHTLHCHGCRDIIVASEELDALLRAMPEEKVSESLVPSTMACIARHEASRVRRPPVLIRAHKEHSRRWLAMIAGCVVGLGAYLAAVFSGQSVLAGLARFSLDEVLNKHWADPLVILGVGGALLCLLGIGDPGVDAPNRDDRKE